MGGGPRPSNWFAASARPTVRRPALAGDRHCDVCVVGGGYTGLSAALELAERGYDCVVLEGAVLGYGASGRNGGQIVSGYNPDMEVIAARHGADTARWLWRIAEESKTLLRERIRRHAIACDLTDGYFFAATHQRHLRSLSAWQQEWEQVYGYPHLTLVSGKDVPRYVDSPLYLGGMLDQGGGHLHPVNYLLGLADIAETAGAVILENTPVQRVTPGPAPAVHTARGTVHCRWLVMATNGSLALPSEARGRYTMPAATCLLATAPLGAPAMARLLPTGAAACDLNRIVTYFRPTHDHRLVFGGGASYSGHADPGYRAWLSQQLRITFPSLAGVPLEHYWDGTVAITRNRLPQFGRAGSNILFAQGFSGQGVALTALAGRLMAETIAGTAERFDLFSAIPHTRFPGGRWLNTPLLMLAMAWFKLRDRLG